MTETVRTAKGYYSILRYVPDLERGEGCKHWSRIVLPGEMLSQGKNSSRQ